MLTLYYKPSCPFCKKVLEAAEKMQIALELKDISVDDALAAELIEKGGKRQVPYLVDSDKDTALYESNDIIAYLAEYYSDTPKPSVHTAGGGTCSI